jgi:hypothetical protein
MATPSRRGIAEDASQFEDFPEPTQDPARGARADRPRSGVADDAETLADAVAGPDDDGVSLESTWLYKADGRVFGPVTSRVLLEKLYAGELDAETPISPEDGEFLALRRYGAFRTHLPRVDAHRARVVETEAENKAHKQKHTRNVLVLSLTAVLVLGAGGWAVFRYVETSRVEAAEQAKAREEKERRAAIERMLANLTIEPPLVELADDQDKTPTGAKARGDRRRERIEKARQLPPTVALTRQEVMDGVTESFAGIKRCILDQTERDPDSVHDRLVMTFTVNNQGMVENFDLEDRQLRRAPIKDCLASKVGALRFRRYQGEVQSIEYPITIGGRR